MTHSLHPVLEINLNNIKHNYRVLCQQASTAQVAGVVKADSYGLGAVAVAKALYEEGCRLFFVAYASEGAEIRSVVPDAEIFILQGISPEDKQDVITANLTPVLATPEMLTLWKSWQIDRKPAIQVETGLNRLGFRKEDIQALTDTEKENFSLILSHLACADVPADTMNRKQLDQLEEIKKVFPKIPVSLSASGGIFLGKRYWQDIVRPGAALYGLRQNFCPPSILPVVQLSACIAQTAVLKKGQSVSYGATFKAPCEMKIAIVSFGYADGFPWLTSMTRRGKVFIHQKPASILGRIAMDSIMCDITRIPEAKIFERAYLVDPAYTLDMMVTDSGTLSYELLTRLSTGRRTQKVYVEEFSSTDK